MSMYDKNQYNIVISPQLIKINEKKSINSLVLSFLYDTTLTSENDYCKNHTLTIQTFVGKVMSLLFNILSRFVIAFLLRSKHLLITWL